jgi:hypothetical protein
MAREARRKQNADRMRNMMAEKREKKVLSSSFLSFLFYLLALFVPPLRSKSMQLVEYKEAFEPLETLKQDR